MPELIRETRSGDGPALVEMVRELADFEKLLDKCLLTVELAERHLTGGFDGIRTWIVEVDGRAAGYAVTYRSFSTFVGRPGVYLEDLYVRPEYRGRGLGLRLMETVRDAATSGEAGRLEWLALDWNVNAREFYKRFGAAELPQWVFFRMEFG